MKATNDEARLQLERWRKEKTPVTVMLSTAVGRSSLRMCGVIVEIPPTLSVVSPLGHTFGTAFCDLSAVTSWEYGEMSDIPARLVEKFGTPSAVDGWFMLSAVFAEGNTLILCDARITIPDR